MPIGQVAAWPWRPLQLVCHGLITVKPTPFNRSFTFLVARSVIPQAGNSCNPSSLAWDGSTSQQHDISVEKNHNFGTLGEPGWLPCRTARRRGRSKSSGAYSQIYKAGTYRLLTIYRRPIGIRTAMHCNAEFAASLIFRQKDIFVQRCLDSELASSQLVWEICES